MWLTFTNKSSLSFLAIYLTHSLHIHWTHYHSVCTITLTMMHTSISHASFLCIPFMICYYSIWHILLLLLSLKYLLVWNCGVQDQKLQPLYVEFRELELVYNFLMRSWRQEPIIKTYNLLALVIGNQVVTNNHLVQV